MKKLLVFGILCAFIFSVSAQADSGQKKLDAAKQPVPMAPKGPVPPDRPAKCGAMDCQALMKVKREYFETNFKLEDAQKEAFWKAYDEYAQAEFDAFKQGRAMMEAAGLKDFVRPDSVQYLPDAQILAIYNSKFLTREMLAKAETNLFMSLTKCLTAKQVNEYYQLERKFKRSAAKHNPDHKCGEKCNHPAPPPGESAEPGERPFPPVHSGPAQVTPIQK